MAPRVALLAVVLLAGTARAEESLRVVSWSEEQRAGRVSGSLVTVPGEGGAVLAIENPRGAEQVTPLVSFDDPGVTADRYAIQGRVRYEGVAGQAFLRMWHHAPGGAAYFSRSWGNVGPGRTLSGTSDWRDFTLPFYLEYGSPRPERVTLELVLPRRGKVWLGRTRLVQFGPNEDPSRALGAWWSDRQAGLLGGLVGGALGCLGALIGTLAGAGRARPFVLGALLLMGVAGAAMLAAGAFALLRAQPYAVWYPLLLTGGISMILGFSMRPGVARRYEDQELRRMRAMDAHPR